MLSLANRSKTMICDRWRLDNFGWNFCKRQLKRQTSLMAVQPVAPSVSIKGIQLDIAVGTEAMKFDV